MTQTKIQRLVHPKHRIFSVEKSSIEILSSNTGQPVSFPPGAILPKPPKLVKVPKPVVPGTKADIFKFLIRDVKGVNGIKCVVGREKTLQYSNT